MGREAQCLCRIGTDTGQVKAYLESTTLILRGGFSRSYELALLQRVQVTDGQLCFDAGNESVALHLGELEGARWVKKMLTPPPTLAAKLGVGPECKVFVTGRLEDASLAEAVDGACAATPGEAQLLLAIVLSEDELLAAIGMHREMVCRAVWIVHEKGKSAALGDAAIRQIMRANGYVDNKTSAVSARLTSTRYVKR